MSQTEKIAAKHSVIGVTHNTPLIPKNFGRKYIVGIKNIVNLEPAERTAIHGRPMARKKLLVIIQVAMKICPVKIMRNDIIAKS